MILLFSDFNALRTALADAIVPAAVTLAPAAVSFDGQGKIYVEPTATINKTVEKNLAKIGVKGSKRHAGDSPEEVQSWLQILPVAKDAAPPVLSKDAPVLFELMSAEDLPLLVSEMLRLGNDRQSFRWFAGAGEGESRRVLLQVKGPPYYTLLRALDRGAAGGVRAYIERAQGSRVWVEIGYSHPLGGQIRPADGQMILVRAPRDWLFLDDAPFQDVYDLMNFKLPASAVAWTEAKAPKKMTVPLRLTAGNAADIPELWVLREGAVEQLDDLVRDADDKTVQRLTFAVATDKNKQRTVVLRIRPSKQQPPVLPLENAVEFKPFWKLPNLFVPVGKRLHPTLRRDAVRKLLADDADQVVWLFPNGDHSFTPESVPDAAFRPLEDWVDYVIEAEQQQLGAWIEATRFDFDHFVCKEAGGPKNKPDKGDKEPRAKEDDDVKPGGKATVAQPKTGGKTKPANKATDPTDFLPPPEAPKPPSEWKLKREQLEKRFMEIEGDLDAPERQDLWPELAKANTALGEPIEASVCWLNAMWDTDPVPGEWVGGWFRSELPNATGMKADEFDRMLANRTVNVGDARAVIASFLWLAAQNPVPAWLAGRLPEIQKFLEKHERAIPVRGVWMTGYRLAQLAGHDVLGLARVRDRVLLRLHEEGLSPERDQPSFLRFAGLRDSERLRVVRGEAGALHQTVRKWVEKSAVPPKGNENLKQNLAYIDLLFAFALGKLGETSKAKELLDAAQKAMEVPTPPMPANPQSDQAATQAVQTAVVRNYLFKAFKYRVEQVMTGKPHAGPMPADVAKALDEIADKGVKGPTNNPYKLAKYVIDRMREQSGILEPQEKLDPYADWTKHGDELKKQLAELSGVRDPQKLQDKIRRLYREGATGKTTKEVQFQVLHESIPLTPRVGEPFAVEMLGHVFGALTVGPPAKDEAADTQKKQGELLARSLSVAGHFGQGDLVQKLVAQFGDLVHSKPEETRFKLINVVAGQALKSLRKLGLRDEIDKFLTRLQSEVLQGANLQSLRKRYAAKPDSWAAVLQTLLNLAAGWLTFGLNEPAAPILNEARNELLGPNGLKFLPKDYTDLAKTYVAALGQGPSEAALPRIKDLFTDMDVGKITNTWTTAPHYSRLHLNLVEEVIQAVVSDEFALGPAGKKWLYDDEYLVRRRVHADMHRERQRAGL
jgi:hypothetical protein